MSTVVIDPAQDVWVKFTPEAENFVRSLAGMYEGVCLHSHAEPMGVVMCATALIGVQHHVRQGQGRLVSRQSFAANKA